ncbi:uncharacterized protein [Nicotiana sylvestris]|uniref:uncharacterized protein n=1 Tax=Nicotiana sylvestris TaxID=4096 RepID=UPI00388C9831
MQLKRRDTQSQISARRKEAMLLSRRMRRQNFAKHNLLESLIVAVPEQATSSWDKTGFLKQTALTIREPPSLAEKVMDNLEKENSILGPPIIRETGSTSGTSKLPPVSLRCSNQSRARKVCLAAKEQRSDYVALKNILHYQYCRAKRFEYEHPRFCCNSGAIRSTSHKMLPELSELYFGNTKESENFQTYIRTYNNIFAFTSLGVKYDKELARKNCGIYTFRVHGKIYHFIDDLIPSNEKPRNLQLYFYDHDHELANRMACSTRTNESIVKKLMDILKVNPYTIFLKCLLNVPQLSDFYIALKCHSTLDQRTYNLPSSSEIAALWLEENPIDIYAPHIRIYTDSNRARLVHYYYGCYDQLLFSFGEKGWHCEIKKTIQTNIVTKHRTYCEHEQLPSISNMCSVDGFLDMEDESLQKGKRKRDTVSCREEASKIEKKMFLPVTFIRGPRDMRRRYMDAIALVQNRPDLVSRVFRAKVEELKTDIIKRQIFGRVAGFMYTIEFQKRELPDSKKDRDLYSLAIKHMMHGPSGKVNPTNICMKNNNCKFKYPKDFAEQTLKGKKSYPIYRRRRTGEAVEEVVKYIYKYICKGHDKITFHIHASDTDIDIDEIKEYQYAIWVSPPEAAWRLFRFPISEMTPSVFHLQLYLEGQQFVSFKSIENVDRILSNSMIQKIMLTEFFVMNRTNKDAMQLEAAEKRGLLYCDNNLVECISEATNYQMLYSLSRLFATLLVYCNPTNPAELWKQFEDSMSEDFKNIRNMNAKDICFMALNHINDILHLMGRDINEYNLIPEKIKPSTAIRETNDSTASLGVVALILPGGRTTHSLFKCPIDIDEQYSCNISKQSALATLIRDAKLIVWDEVSMAKKKVIETFYILLKDLMDTNALFAGKIVVFGDLLLRVTYPDLHTCFSDVSSITSRVILTTKNDFVDEINDLLIAQIPGDPKTYVAFDETIEANDQSHYEDFLHTLHPADFSNESGSLSYYMSSYSDQCVSQCYLSSQWVRISSKNESSYTNEKRWYFLGHQSGRFVRGLTKESNPKQMLKRAGKAPLSDIDQCLKLMSKRRCGLLRCSPFLELLVVLYPVARPGITALPPIFGAVGRTGIMSTSESFDKVEPFCRSAADCATSITFNASAAGRSVVADVKSAGVIGAASGLAKIVYSKYEPAAKGLYTKYEPMSNMQHQLGSL